VLRTPTQPKPNDRRISRCTASFKEQQPTMPSTNGFYLTDVCDCGHDRADHVRVEHSRFLCAECTCTDFAQSPGTEPVAHVVIPTDAEHLDQLTNRLSQLQAQRDFHLGAVDDLNGQIDVNIAARVRVLAALRATCAVALDEM
jgi:hypothetical protein